MAVRNGEQHLRAAVDSVLAQTVSDFEFIIVDDGSTDTTRSILAEYERRDTRVRVLRNAQPLGPYPSANRGLSEAAGAIIARQDADDTSPPERFAIQLDALRAKRHTTLVAGAVEVFDSSSPDRRWVLRPPSWQPRLEWELLFGNAIGAGGHVMFPRVVDRMPVRFPCRRRYAEDYALWTSLIQRGRVSCPSDIVYRYRQHSDSITSLRAREQADDASEIRAEYQRQFIDSRRSRAESDVLARFWDMSAGRLQDGDMETVTARFVTLTATFLAYVDSRYGASARKALAIQLDAAVRRRLGFWAFRALRAGDFRGVRDVRAIARQRQTLASLIAVTAEQCGAAFIRKAFGSFTGVRQVRSASPNRPNRIHQPNL